MKQSEEQLTASLQTPPGKGGIAVIVLAGSGRAATLQTIFRPHGEGSDAPSTEAGRMQLGYLMDGDEVIDEAIVAHSVRGVEINIHGGPAATRRTLRCLSALGARILEAPAPAFDPNHPQWANPAIGHELQAHLPSAASDLVVATLTNQWSAGLSQLARETLDAPTPLDHSADQLTEAAEAFSIVQRLLHPPEVVLAGPPNAGKSTLANVLVGRAVSIVHHHAGTTRDWIRERAILAGRCVYLTDTAGLWEADHPIDVESVRRAWERIESADLVLLLSPENPIELPPGVHAKAHLHVRTKADEADRICKTNSLAVSAHTRRGLSELTTAILEALGLAKLDPTRAMAFTQHQAELLHAASQALREGDTSGAHRQLRQLLEKTNE